MEEQGVATLAALALGLGAATLAGTLAERAGLPSVVGKIGAGLLLGPALLAALRPDGALESFAQAGVVLLMFVAGLESDPRSLRAVGLPAAAVAAGGVALPLACGLALGRWLGLTHREALFLGAILTATSVSISAQVLRELGRLSSREGTIILGAAVLDDVLGMAVLAWVVALSGGGSPLEAVLRMALFLGAFLALGCPLAHLAVRLLSPLSAQARLAFVLAAALACGWLAQDQGGLAAITGSYLGGLFLGRTALGPELRERVAWLGDGLFVPLFFLTVGLQADPGSLPGAPALALAMTAVAVASKALGCLAGGLAARLPFREAAVVATGMVSRGEVALVIAAVGLSSGAIGIPLYSASVAMALATTLATPLLLKLALRLRATGAAPTALPALEELGP